VTVSPLSTLVRKPCAWRMKRLPNGLPDPTVAGWYRDEERLLHEAIDLDELLDIERRTVEN